MQALRAILRAIEQFRNRRDSSLLAASHGATPFAGVGRRGRRHRAGHALL